MIVVLKCDTLCHSFQIQTQPSDFNPDRNDTHHPWIRTSSLQSRLCQAPIHAEKLQNSSGITGDVHFEDVAISMELNEFVPEHTRLHTTEQKIFGFIIGRYVNINLSEQL